MRRLSIIDVAGSDQPLHTADGKLSIVYNGESYNFAEKRRELEAEGVVFHTDGDTETVLQLYARHGEACVQHLRGMYAFCILDRRRDKLFFARDRIGKKPLYYFFDGKIFIYGSELKSILVAMQRLGLARPEVNREAISIYMGYGYIPAPLTIFEGIKKLPPGHTLSLEKTSLRTTRYWQYSLEANEEMSEDQHLDAFRSALEDSVRMRLISDVPLGAYLSGGIDSSTVVGIMSRVSSTPVKTFSIGFEDASFDELPYARMVAEHLGTEHHEEVVRPDADEIIEDLVRHFDEPFADSSAIPTYYVSKMARRHVTCVLSGDGGDELFAGYSRYRANEAQGWLGTLPLPLRKVLFGMPARLLPAGAYGQGRLFNLALADDPRYIHQLTSGLADWHRELYRPEFAGDLKTTDPSGPFLNKMAEVADLDPIARKMFADFHLYLPADIMVKVDRMSMMVSLEARAPLLDHVVCEVAGRIPMSLKIKNGESKYLLKRLARQLVPSTAIDRKKQGFAVPVSRWFNEAWADRTDELLASVASAERGVFREDSIKRIKDEHRRGRRDHSQLMWSLMMLELWFRQYVDDKAYGN